jgi:glucose-1-phosphate thymidylyltransferase
LSSPGHSLNRDELQVIAIILAGGFAKRLLPLSLEEPKCLLPLRGKPVIDRALEWISSSSQAISKIVVLTSSRFEARFQTWAQGKDLRVIEVVSDGSWNENEKPGAVGALALIAPKIDQDFLVIAGDCTYPGKIDGLLKYFHGAHSPVIGLYYAKNADQVRRGSVVKVKGNIITDFVEKPENPTSDLVGAVVYVFPQMIKNRLAEYCRLQLSRDEPGRFIEWLCKKETLHAYVFDGMVLDIGTMEAYEQSNKASEKPQF